MSVRSISVALSASIGNYVGNLKQAGQSTLALGAEMDTLSKTSKTKFNDVMKASAVVGVGLLGIAAAAEKAAIDFDKQMSQVQSASNATAGQLSQLRDAAIVAGKDTAYSASEAAEAEAELAKAGVSTADILKGGLKGALSLAAAGQLDLKDAATDTAQALNIFGLRGADASHVADVLAAGANTSATDVGQLSYSLNQAGLVAHQTGLSLEDTVGTLAALAQNGLVGSDAGTSLKTMLQSLQAPSAKTAGLMQQLGIDMYDTSGKFIGITALAQQLQTQLGGLTQQQRDAAMAQIFGSDAVRAANVLYTEGADGLSKWISGVNDSGAASRTAAQKMNNLSGDVEQLKGSMETLAIEGSGGVTKGLRAMTQGANDLVGKLIDLPPVLSETLTVASGVGGVLVLGATGFVKAKSALTSFTESLESMGPAGIKASETLGKVGSVAGKLGLAGAGIGLVIWGLSSLASWAEKKSGPTARNIDDVTTSLKDLATYGRDINGELTTMFGKGFVGLSTDIAQIQEAKIQFGALDAAQEKYRSNLAGRGEIYSDLKLAPTVDSSQAKSDLAALDTALSGMATNGGLAQAKLAFQDLAASQNWTDLETKQALALLPKYNSAMTGAAAANTGAAQGFGDTAAQVQTLTTSLSDAIEKGDTFLGVWGELNGALFSSDKAGLAAHQAIDNVTKTLKENKDAWRGNSEAAQANRVVIGEAAEAAAKAADTKYQETNSVAAANDVYNSYIGQLRKSMLAAGLSTTAVNTLLGQYAKMPATVTTTIKTPNLQTANDTASGYSRVLNDIKPSVSTTIKVPGLASALSGVRTLYTDIDQLHGKTVNVTVHYSNGLAASTNRWGGLYKHAADGLLSQASTYSAVNPGRYMIAEPSTGGEAFVPRYGDYSRSMSILGQAAGWYGAQVIPGGMGGGGSSDVSVHFSADPGAATVLTNQLRLIVNKVGGGNVQYAFGKR